MLKTQIPLRYVLFLIIAFSCLLLNIYQHGNFTCLAPNIYIQGGRRQIPTIYAITATYKRPAQKAELTRLSHLFMLLPHLYWIIVEDANSTSTTVRKVLASAGLKKRSIQLYCPTPAKYKLIKSTDPYYLQPPHGLWQKNRALSWIRANVHPRHHSLVYFMDDDNTYSVKLFLEMTKIHPGRVGIWPVGLVGGLLVERPVLNEYNTAVLTYNAMWRPERPFPTDMAGFAIAIDLLFKYPQAKFTFKHQLFDEESEILGHVTQGKKLQPLANNCMEVLVWHTKTVRAKLN